MHLIELSDAASFLTRSGSLLLESEAQNNLLLSSSLSLAKASVTRSLKLAFFVVEKNRKAVCVALNSAERRLLIAGAPSMDTEAAIYMGQELAARTMPIKAVFGPNEAAAAFSSGYSGAGGFTMLAKPSQNVLKLESSTTLAGLNIKSATGIARVAKDKDLKLCLKWSRQFVEESGIDESVRESEDILRRYIDSRQLMIWEDKAPVAMAGYNGVTPNGVRVSMVYTDPVYRKRGYAGTLVNVLSRKLLADGHRSCFLYVDSSNTYANRIYERIGYQSVGSCVEFRVTSGNSASSVKITG